MIKFYKGGQYFMKKLFGIFRALKKYSAIKANETKKATSKYYAMHTIVYSLLAIVLSTTCLIIGQFGITEHVFASVMLLIFLSLLAYILPFIFLFYAFTYLIVQFSLNGRGFSWLALMVFMLSASGALYIILSTI